MSVTVILPCASDDGLDRCLGSIDEDVEVLGVLNRPTPAMRARVAAWGLDTVEIGERNLGAACDAGCEAARTEHVLLMNTDSWLRPGALRTLLDDAATHPVVRATLDYAGKGPATRVIANLQQHHLDDPPKAYQPGLLFRRDIVDRIGGYFFDRDIHWTEDADFDRRLRAAGVPVHVSAGVVVHGEVSLPRKLRSAFRYGLGRAVAERKQLVGTQPPFRLTAGGMAAEWRRLRGTYGTATAAYGQVWTLAFAAGVATQRRFEVYRVHDRAGPRTRHG